MPVPEGVSIRLCVLPIPVARFHSDDAERSLTSDTDSSNLPFVGVRLPVPAQVPHFTLIPGRAVR
jgi:hypothetical protein